VSLPPLKGLKSLDRKLASIAKAAPRAAERACLPAALLIEGAAKERCPVNTGMLRESITSARIPRGAQVGPHTDYAAYVEYGTRHMAAQPYMGPAVDAKRAEVVRLVGEAVRIEVRRKAEAK